MTRLTHTCQDTPLAPCNACDRPRCYDVVPVSTLVGFKYEIWEAAPHLFIAATETEENAELVRSALEAYHAG